MTATETTLNGRSILSIEDATPTGMALEIRAARRDTVVLNLHLATVPCLYVNNVPIQDVLVGRISDELSCLYVGPVAIDVRPEAAAVLNAWIGARIKGATG